MSENQIHLLHIEEDGVDKMVVERVLKKLNIAASLHHAQNGEEALDKLRGTNGQKILSPFPQIILLDLNMPKMNGIEFLKELRGDAALKHLSVFVVTTSNDDRDRRD